MKTALCFLVLLNLGFSWASAETEAERDRRMAWWREARFGMFVHWGLYSGLAGSWQGKASPRDNNQEWIQNYMKLDTATYAAEALPKFVPKPGFAEAWAKLAKEAGCKYVVFTTKHHEGFALHASKAGDFHAGAALQRDLVKEIVGALRAEGLRVGFYHSLIDWHHPQYDYTRAKGLPYPLKEVRDLPPRDHSKYIAYLHAQADELMSNYGVVDVVWWDYSRKDFEGDAAWGATELMRKVRAKQPGIIFNNRLYGTSAGNHMGKDLSEFDRTKGDFFTPEQNVPAKGIAGVDWETCMTLNNTWGFSEHDTRWKSSRVLIRQLIDSASKGGNYLLNIGPKGDGTIPEASVKSFRDIGVWMKVNGEAIYGTTASPFEMLSWGRCTRKGQTLYFHVFENPQNRRLMVPLKNKVVSARMLADAAKVPSVESTSEGWVITLPESVHDADATVFALEIEGDPAVVSIAQ